MRRLILGLAVAATTLVPSVVSADDTQIADFIQTRLQTEQQQGRLSGFNVDMQVEQGTVWFKGTVSNAQQEMLILQTAQKAGHLGVVQVVDDIEVTSASQAVYSQQSASDSVLKPVAYQQAQKPAAQKPAAPMPTPAMPASFAMPPTNDGAMMGGQVITGEPMPFATAGGGEPMPMGQAGMGTPSGSPNLPGYAWPGYAAHPNFGAVSYPRQYSASAWPYIGPFYPYPQVPLGWRKVSLEWDDGFWHLDFHDKSRH